MNIFALSNDPRLAAVYACDSHVVKMVLESAQLLSAVWRLSGEECPPRTYALSHPKHPCTLWTAASTGNYDWLYRHAVALAFEKQHRWPGRPVHASARVLSALRKPPASVPSGPLAPFVQCMPPELRGPDAVAAYRRYYAVSKRHLHRWTNRDRPYWLD